MINVDLVFFDAGGGHRAAAEALSLVMEEQGGWKIRLVNLQEVMDPIDLVRKLTGIVSRSEDLVRIGAYKPGVDAELDRALAARGPMREFMIQDAHEHVGFADCLARLSALSQEI